MTLFPDTVTASSVIVFTDLDGSLLDHDSYSHQPAASALDRLQQLGVPCIPVTSKTRAEVLAIRSTLNLNTPFIVENGAAAFIPDGSPGFNCSELPAADESGLQTKAFSRAYGDILHDLRQLARKSGYHWRGFHDMDVDEVAQRTGLSRAAAERASRREYCEPVIWQDDQDKLEAFISMLDTHGLRCVRGGRFLHIMDAMADKGRAIQWLRQHYSDGRVTSIALGDSDNDAGMLAAADIAVLIRAPHHAFPEAEGKRQTLRTQACGPAGWAEAMHGILDALEEKQEPLTHG